MISNSAKRIAVFIGALFVVSFLLNAIWEMVQMSGFSEMNERPWTATLMRCAVATLADVGITFAVYSLVALAAGSLVWARHGRWNTFLAASLLGMAHASLTEKWALAAGRWSYNAKMITVPLLEVGLWPFLQLAILVPLSIWIAGFTAWRNEKRTS